MKEDELSRRSFLKYSFVGMFLAPFILSSRTDALCTPGTPPAGKPIAKPNEGMGKPLHYVEKAEESKHGKYKKGQDCSNCKFYIVAKESNGYAPCTMLGMKYVTRCGWCSSYAVK